MPKRSGLAAARPGELRVGVSCASVHIGPCWHIIRKYTSVLAVQVNTRSGGPHLSPKTQLATFHVTRLSLCLAAI